MDEACGADEAAQGCEVCWSYRACSGGRLRVCPWCAGEKGPAKLRRRGTYHSPKGRPIPSPFDPRAGLKQAASG